MPVLYTFYPDGGLIVGNSETGQAAYAHPDSEAGFEARTTPEEIVRWMAKTMDQRGGFSINNHSDEQNSYAKEQEGLWDWLNGSLADGSATQLPALGPQQPDTYHGRRDERIEQDRPLEPFFRLMTTLRVNAGEEGATVANYTEQERGMLQPGERVFLAPRRHQVHVGQQGDTRDDALEKVLVAEFSAGERFNGWEVSQVVEFRTADLKAGQAVNVCEPLAGTGFTLEQARQQPDYVADFWTVYGHLPSGGVNAIEDFATEIEARDFLAAVTGDRVADQNAPPIHREKVPAMEQHDALSQLVRTLEDAEPRLPGVIPAEPEQHPLPGIDRNQGRSL